MFKFAQPEYLYLLLLIPLLWLFFIYSLIIKNRRLTKLGSKTILKQLMPNVSHWRPRAKFYLSLMALIFALLMLARPQMATKSETVKRQGVELIIALDVSNSMLANDVQPNRMEASKRLLSRLIDELQDDKVGIIVFAGDAFVQMPITTDVMSAKMLLSNINTGIVPTQGTAIGAALQSATRLFGPANAAERAIIVITDGENHEDKPVEMAQEALNMGIKTHVLGVGTPQGSPIPILDTNDFWRDKEGNVVVTKLNESMCQEIAQAGGGIYTQVDNTNTALRVLKLQLDTMSKSDMETKVYSGYDEYFRILAWLSLLLLLVDLLLSERKNHRLYKIKLF
ncbi:MAG: VWA domain-containing protein [Paludibacteraceae bacterium]|nr:VWA domain-containing protein [Paludibacteraceae bacterium]MBP6284468.1 VWA domain-containing protein [Paludibacteraceae bacterium]